jgi:hypothetical protein
MLFSLIIDADRITGSEYNKRGAAALGLTGRQAGIIVPIVVACPRTSSARL